MTPPLPSRAPHPSARVRSAVPPLAASSGTPPAASSSAAGGFSHQLPPRPNKRGALPTVMTDDMGKRAVVLLRAGASLTEAATVLGVSRLTLHGWAERRNLRFADGRQRPHVSLPTLPRWKPSKVLAERRKQWRALADAGLTASQAAAHMGCKRSAAKMAAQRGGFRFRDFLDAKRDQDERLRPMLVALAADGCWMAEAARRLGFDKKTMWSLVRRLGVEFPPRRRARPRDPLASLTPEELADWRLFRRKVGRDEALRIVLDERERKARRAA